MNFKHVLVFAAIFFLGTAFTGAGKVFPKVDLKDLKSNPVKTDSFINDGKVTVVTFFATWCKPCQLEMDNIAEIYPDWQEAYDVEMVAISVDNARGAAKLNSLVKSKGWEYNILVDDKQQIQNILGFQTIPQTFLLDKEGNIVYEHNGYKPGDEIELEDHIIEIAGE